MVNKNLFLLAFILYSFLGFAQNDSIPHDLLTPNSEKPIVPVAKDEPFTAVQEMPQFLAGDRDKSESAMMKYIIENIVYPKDALKKKIEGKVRVKFTVSNTGEILDVHIISKDKLGYGCEEEAIRVIESMPNWKKPGTQNGIPVFVYFNIPINFRIY